MVSPECQPPRGYGRLPHTQKLERDLPGEMWSWTEPHTAKDSRRFRAEVRVWRVRGQCLPGASIWQGQTLAQTQEQDCPFEDPGDRETETDLHMGALVQHSWNRAARDCTSASWNDRTDKKPDPAGASLMDSTDAPVVSLEASPIVRGEQLVAAWESSKTWKVSPRKLDVIKGMYGANVALNSERNLVEP